jgi:hypothetical protein
VKPQSRLLILPKEAETFKKQYPFRPSTSNFCPTFDSKTVSIGHHHPHHHHFHQTMKAKRCASIAGIQQQPQQQNELAAAKPRLSTAMSSPREIMHQIRHVGALIKQNTLSPVCVTATVKKKKAAEEMRIRYVIASAYDTYT